MGLVPDLARTARRAPVIAKPMLLEDDLLACVMGGVYAEVGKTMIELLLLEPKLPLTP